MTPQICHRIHRGSIHQKRRHAANGAALLTAMIIVALVATLASAMVWQQWQAVELEVGERSQAQAVGILDGALDWSRLILREDLREGIRKDSSSSADHLGEPWAVPLAEARLSTFLAADKNNTDDAPEAFMSGSIVDAQSRYNLRNLVAHDQSVSLAEAETLRRLARQAGLTDAWTNVLIERITAALAATGQDASGAARPPLLPPDERHLEWLGLDTESLRRLRPWITLLPRATPINLNTAPREVILAVMEGSDLAGVERLLQGRQRQYLRRPEDARQWLGTQVQISNQRVDIKSQFFEVTGAMRQGPMIVVQRSLIERRSPRDIQVRRTERVAPEELATSSAMH